MNTIAVSKLRSNLPAIVDKISRSRKTLTITVYGKSKAVIISYNKYKSLLTKINNNETI